MFIKIINKTDHWPKKFYIKRQLENQYVYGINSSTIIIWIICFSWKWKQNWKIPYQYDWFRICCWSMHKYKLCQNKSDNNLKTVYNSQDAGKIIIQHRNLRHLKEIIIIKKNYLYLIHCKLLNNLELSENKIYFFF